jgi:hypothetical protein
MDGYRKGRDWARTIGTVLVIMGVCVWGVFVIERYILKMDVNSLQFLAYHLAGVIPGTVLRHHKFFIGLVKKHVRNRTVSTLNSIFTSKF